MSELLGKFFGSKDKHGSSSQNKDKSSTGGGGSVASGGGGGTVAAAAGERNPSPGQTGQQQQPAGLPRGPIMPASRNPVEFSEYIFQI